MRPEVGLQTDLNYDLINIPFIRGQVTIGAAKTPDLYLSTLLNTSVLNIGASFGVVGQWGGGSLGAYMSLNIKETRDAAVRCSATESPGDRSVDRNNSHSMEQ